jgi:subtilisin family serine protease
VTASTPIQTWNQDLADTQGSPWTGAGVTVAVVDAGLPQNWQEFLPAGSVDLDHAVGFGAEGWGDYHAQTNAIRGVGGHIGQFPHGLAVSSLIVGFPSEFGPIAGAAPGARILPVRVLNQFNFGWISWFTAGILHVANLKASGAIAGPVVINFSIQISAFSPTLADAIDYAISRGVIFVTIAGNFNPHDVVSFPGRLPEAITAAAAGWRSEGTAAAPWFFADVPEADASQVYVASFSGREPALVPAGSQIDVVAPGSFVFGEWAFGPGFSEGRAVGFDAVDNFIFGTSFAAPHVAGIVAQMLEKNPTLNQSAVEHLLRDTALPLPASPSPFSTAFSFVLPWDARATGAGLVQGAAAVAATPTPAAMTGAAAATRSVPQVEAARPLRLRSRTGSLPIEIEWAPLARGSWTVTVVDVQGRVVRRWSQTSSPAARITWDGRSASGDRRGPGVYFIRLEGPDRSATTRTVVLAR